MGEHALPSSAITDSGWIQVGMILWSAILFSKGGLKSRND
jgi:hypothetical protein